MVFNGKILDKLKGVGLFLMKVFGVFVVYFEILGLDCIGFCDC